MSDLIFISLQKSYKLVVALSGGGGQLRDFFCDRSANLQGVSLGFDIK